MSQPIQQTQKDDNILRTTEQPLNDSGAGSAPRHDWHEALKRSVQRLPDEVKGQLLADLPPPEELERLYRELQQSGGLSSEEFLTVLGRAVESQP